jgi:predicted acylesterase/phospholipase RssA
MAAFSDSKLRSFTKPTHIVIGPCGSKGFYSLDMLSNVVGYSGSSAGAMIALLMTCGYKPSKINRMAVETNLFANFFSTKIVRKLNEIRDNCGILSNDIIRQKLEHAVTSKFGKSLSMKELYDRTGIMFQSITYDVRNDASFYINYITSPDIDVVQAVLFSINIPLIFYRLTYGSHEFIDGAFCDPLPIFPFDDGVNKVLTIYVNTKNSVPAKDSLVDGISFGIQKMVTTGIHQYRDTIMSFASRKCDFLKITSSITDTTGSTITMEEKVDMFFYGVRMVDDYLSHDVVEDEDVPDEGSNSIKFQYLRNVQKDRPFEFPD